MARASCGVMHMVAGGAGVRSVGESAVGEEAVWVRVGAGWWYACCVAVCLDGGGVGVVWRAHPNGSDATGEELPQISGLKCCCIAGAGASSTSECETEAPWSGPAEL